MEQELGGGTFGGLEDYLRGAPILSLQPLHTGTYEHHKGKQRVLLHGGVLAICKPANGCPNGETVVRCEAAAWLVAKLLGWTDLVPTTILRTMPVLNGGEALCSVQIVIENADAHVWNDDFDEIDILKAGIFDFLIAETDRTHNWLFTRSEFGQPRIILIDHGLSFATTDRPFRSRFFEEAEEREIPQRFIDAIRRLVDELPRSDFSSLVGSEAAEGLVKRAEHVLNARKLSNRQAAATEGPVPEEGQRQ